MACNIARPSPQELFDRYRDMFSATVLGGSPVIPESNEWYVLSLEYAAAEEFYSISEQQWRERDPRYACCDNLYLLAEADGVYPRPASFAQGFVKVTGVPGTIVPVGVSFTIGGKTYDSVTTTAQVIPSGGELQMRIRSQNPGADGNVLGSVTTGTINSAITGLDRNVSIYGGIVCGGADQELCEAFRARYLLRKQYQPRATDGWIKEKLLEWPCATRVCRREGSCCDPDEVLCKDCANKFEYYLMFDNTFDCGLAQQCIVDEVTDYIFGVPQGYGLGVAEMGICGKIYTATGIKVNVKIAGAGCTTPAQQAEARERIADFFKTICPSQPVYVRNLEAILVQIFGGDLNFAVLITFPVKDVIIDAPYGSEVVGARMTECGIEVDCDYLLCLDSILFVDDGNFDGCS